MIEQVFMTKELWLIFIINDDLIVTHFDPHESKIPTLKFYIYIFPC